jgi:hypothetical protein
MDDDALHTRLQEMIDRADIHDCMVRYARGMDRRDRDLLRSAYHDGAIDDHVGFVGLVDDFIDWALPYHSPATSTTYSTTVQISAATRATRRPTTSSWAPTGNRKPSHNQRWTLRRPARMSRWQMGYHCTGLHGRMALRIQHPHHEWGDGISCRAPNKCTRSY